MQEITDDKEQIKQYWYSNLKLILFVPESYQVKYGT